MFHQGIFQGVFQVCVWWGRILLNLEKLPSFFVCSRLFLKAWEETRNDAESISADICFYDAFLKVLGEFRKWVFSF